MPNLSSFPERLRSKWLRVASLIAKEAKTLLLDPGVRRILVVPIIAQSILFGYGATFNLERVPFVVVDDSRTPASERLIRAFEGSRLFVRTAPASSAQEMTEAVSGGQALLGIWIPSDFADNIAAGRTAPFYLAADARNSTTANVAAGYAAAIAEALNDEAAQHAGARQSGPIQVVSRYRYNENNITRYNIMTGLILGLSMIQVMLLAGLAVSREREEGSFDMMLMTPLSPGEIFFGKAAPPVLIGIFQGFLIFSVCRWWFEIPFAGSTALLFLIIGLFSISIVGIALAISAMCSTLQQSVVYNFMLLLPSLILSGLMTPVEAMPDWLQTVTEWNPVRFGIEAVRLVYFENASLTEVLPVLSPMLLIMAVTIPGAMRLFRSKVS